MFETDKRTQLSRQDFSKKGAVDEKIKPLISKINSKKEYYTTSSCSGRIMILAEGETKKDTKWIFVSHDKITFKQLKNSLKKIPKQTLWFRFEPMILHAACNLIDSAQKLVDMAKNAGFKKSGIMATSKRIVVEIRGTDFISAPIAFNGKISVDNDYLKVLINEANKKLKRNDGKIKKLKSIF